ncbi:NAD-glutamate dehydrogenase [Roseomonas sp. NAR14]|uniref:NAD-glutamate dehydrogenase n=1 Tax=Roseomonas acroporae TaxID=2937791 RepID=A0A9X2BVL5_9PROT|nr:NAD-glutamate dehydrogenase domain-containing protein [Roseomonas acroporae]MCK8782880.1 NAD-glutamate dehydrogenase [Roseomonas acroporae]
MPDDASQQPPTNPAADTVRAELLNTAAEALRRLAPDLPPDAGVLLHRLYAAVPTGELAVEAPETLAAAAASLWSFAARREPGRAKLRVIPPGPGTGARAVAEIVNDDMPFLVDSALATLTLAGRPVRQLLHPVLTVRRDAAGDLLGLAAGPAAPSPAAPPGGATLRESMMRIAFTGTAREMVGRGLPTGFRAAAGQDEWATLEALLRHTMADVRAATEDFAAMHGFLRAAGDEIAGGEAAGVGPARAFLRWMGEENYVLLGHRRLMLGADGHLAQVPAENLGMLRDPKVVTFDVLRDLGALPTAVQAAILTPEPVSVAKANLRATVHRPQHADVVATRVFDAEGRVTGVRLFLGLFAASAYNRNPRSIPLLAEKVESILARAGLDPESHDGRALRNILDTWPRDELFQAPEEAILAGARRALDLQLRPRAALVVREDPFERFVSAIAWLPRDVFDTALRERIGEMLARAWGGHLSAFYIAMGDTPLARVNYIIGTTPGALPKVDLAALEAAVVQAARSFRGRLGEALAESEGEAAASRLLARWGDAFPAGYRDGATAAQGIADLALAERALATGRPAARLERPPGAAPDQLVLRLARPGGPLPLADALPLLESLDLRAIEETPHHLAPADAPRVVLHVFTLRAGVPVEDAVFPALLATLDALLDGGAEADGFNRLVVRAGLSWRECWLLRTLYRWLKQVGLAFSQASVETTLAAHPEAARILLGLFHARFNPDRGRAAEEEALEAAWTAELDTVTNPDEDRILTRLMTLLRAVLRTNWFQDKPYLAIKIDSAAAGEMPLPRPWREIFVHSVRMEGCHLRAGPVARGGIRWSDRREDFRTEILGLMKAQRLKNVVIVPTGAKGGFVLKHPPPASDREAFMAEGVACYRVLINAMLDLADNIEAGGAVTPPGIVRRDAEDPYIVAAADKGTATFSDIANGIAVERGFWLGDAFASGGSAGYDHKAMGITAKGAWVMIARHFAELGLDIQKDPFTCVGVGDMSGDVFGNGLLVSRETRLLAAFDHRHIFIDPDPDAHLAYEERARMFALPRSSWDDYDRSRISRGGGVFPRSAKTIPLSPEARALLGIEAERAEPAAVMQAILRAPVDLLYFGGIGTYVKAAGETQTEAGDRANDALRVDGAGIRARVIGEGANLGVTQAGRIEYAMRGAGGAGGRINTDALDNSAGVSTSDHEVNIKILLADAERDGALTRRQRDQLLAAMTDEVATLVLRDNHQQSLAVSLEALEGAEALPGHAAMMTLLEEEGLLDRAVAGLPSPTAMQSRLAAGESLTRPEIAALLPVAKLWLTDAIEASDLPDDPAFTQTLLDYFPTELREGYARYAERHRLRRELIATAIANTVANRLGPAALARLAASAGPARIARAAWLAGAAFGLEARDDAVDAAPAPAMARLGATLSLRHLQEAVAHELLGEVEMDRPLAEGIAALRPGIVALSGAAANEAAGGAEAARLREAGLPEELAAEVAAAPALAAAPAIVRLAAATGVPPTEAAAAWRQAGQEFGLEPLRAAAAGLVLRGAFGARAKSALLEDLASAQFRLARATLRGEAPAAPEAAVRLGKEAAATPDLAGLGVAVRAMGALA